MYNSSLIFCNPAITHHKENLWRTLFANRASAPRTRHASTHARWIVSIQRRMSPISRPTMLYIHPEECIDCGACEPACPVTAIFPEDNVPEQWQNYIGINYEHYGIAKK